MDLTASHPVLRFYDDAEQSTVEVLVLDNVHD